MIPGADSTALFEQFWTAFFKVALLHIPEITAGIRAATAATAEDATPPADTEQTHDAIEQARRAGVLPPE